MTRTRDSFWFRAAEWILVATMMAAPLAAYLKAYDVDAAKNAVLQSGLLLLVFAWLFKSLERGRWEIPTRALGLLTPAAAFVGWALFAFILHPHKLGALPGLLEYVLGPVLFVVTLLEFGGQQSIERIVGWTLTAAWTCCLYSLFAWAIGDRLPISLGNPDALAVAMAACVPLALARLTDPRRSTPLRYFDALLAVLLGAGALWARSADGTVAFVVSGLTCAFVLPFFVPMKLARRTAGLSLLLAGFVAAVWFASPILRKRIELEHRVSVEAGSGTLLLAAERPWLGFGPGSFPLELPRVRSRELIASTGHGATILQPGCRILQIAAELGLLGAGLWLWLFFGVLARVFTARRAFLLSGALEENRQLAAVSGSFMSLLLLSQITAAAGGAVPWALLWIFSGLAGGLTVLARKSDYVVAIAMPLPLGWRRTLYAPGLAILAGLLFFPWAWLASDVNLNDAVYHLRRQEWDQALSRFDGVRPSSRDYLMALYLKGNTLREQDKPEAAMAEYARLEAQAPNFGQIHYQEALAFADMEDYDHALVQHALEARLDPLDAPNLVAWSAIARDKGDLKTAESTLKAAIALEPDHPDYWRGLAFVYKLENRSGTSRRAMQEAVRLEKSQSDIPGG